jgi:hypothetical protein
MIDDASKRPRWRELQSKVAAMFNRYRGVTAIENHTLHGARGKVAVDVYVKHDFGPLSFSIIVECKCWGTRVPQEKAHALKSVVEDVGASMGIILTEKGVQSGCATFLAKSTNLSAYRLKELESLFVGIPAKLNACSEGKPNAIHLHPGLLFETIPEHRSESTRNRVHLAPNSPLRARIPECQGHRTTGRRDRRRTVNRGSTSKALRGQPAHTPQPRLSEDHFSTFATALGWRESASGFCSYADIGEIM